MKTILISLVSTVLVALAAHAQAPPHYTVTVALFNDAHVPQNILDNAQQTASYIFLKSGIELHWMLCGRPDESLEESRACSQPGRLDMHIVTGCPNLPSSVFGISYVSPAGIGSQADVFYTRITAFVRAAPRTQRPCWDTPWPTNSDICCSGPTLIPPEA
jgi:hypothetical protein